MQCYSYPSCLTLLLAIGLLQSLPTDACSRKAHVMSKGSDAYSPVDLMNLAKFERTFVNLLEQWSEGIPKEEQDESIKRYLIDYEKTTVRGTGWLPKDTDDLVWATLVAAHPIMVFRMIRRILADLPAVLVALEAQGQTATGPYFVVVGILTPAAYADLLNKISAARDGVKWPTMKDKEDVMGRIIRIQTVYDMDVEKIADGSGQIPEVKLNAKHCVEIGRFALTLSKYASAVEWMNVALRLGFIEALVKDVSVTTDVMLLELGFAGDEHDSVLEHNRLRYLGNLENLWDQDLFKFPVDQLTGIFAKTRLRSLPQNKNDVLYQALQLCNGVALQKAEFDAKLTCWYDTKRHPYSHITPMKLELLSADPYLVRVHDFLSSAGVKSVLDQTTTVLLDEVLGHEAKYSESAALHGDRKRRQAPTLLVDDDSRTDEFKELTSKLECFGGHRAHECSVERLQVSGYTFGASELHLEAPDLGVDLESTALGNFGTMMVFLNNVEKGGLTVFPLLGISVQPSQGSALFWRNSLDSEKRDSRLVYSECPVIVGWKWIAKKKFHFDGEF